MEDKKKLKTFTLLKNLFNVNKSVLCYIAKKYWYFFAIHIIVAVIIGLHAYVSSWMPKAFIDNIIQYGQYKKAMIIVLMFTGIFFIKNILQSTVKILNNYVYSKAIIFSKKKFIDACKKINMAFFDIPQNNDCFARAEHYATGGAEQLISYFFSVISNILSCISVIFLLSSFEIWVVFFLTGLIIIKLSFETKVSKLNYEFKINKTKRERKIGYFSNLFHSKDHITNMDLYGSYKLFFTHYEKNYNEHIHLQKKHNIKIESLLIIMHLLTIIQHVVLYGYIGIKLLNKQVSIGDFTMFFTATGHLNTILMNFKNSINSLYPMMLDAQNYTDFLNTDLSYCFNTETKKIIQTIDCIEFKDVSFKYPSKDTYILENISFKIERGDIVSFVGMNGSGKTTIIKLLLQLYKPTSGKILINNLPLEDIDVTCYWALISPIFQTLITYAVSATENVSMHTVDETDITQVLTGLDSVNLTEKLKGEPMGIYTPLSRSFDLDGIELSGGEKQKISFARAQYKNSDLFILDEPTSALDAVAEEELFNFVSELKEKDKTIIFVSHRLSSGHIANKIIYIENKHIIDCGNHQYMMENCIQYRNLYNLQRKKFK